MAKKLKSRYWSIVAYPDSVPGNWIDILTQTGLCMAISPLHDRDLDPECDPKDPRNKKPHYHVLVCFDGPTTKECVEGIALSIGTQVVTPVNSCRGMYRYHIHMDNPEKAQYDDKDRQFINGFLIENYSNLTASEEIQMARIIEGYIKSENIFEITDLQDFLISEDIQAYAFVFHHTLYFNTILKSRQSKLKSDYKSMRKAYDDLLQDYDRQLQKVGL